MQGGGGLCHHILFEFKFGFISFLFSGMDKGRILIWTPLEREKDEIILRQHSGVVDSLSFSPDGRFLASADTDGKLIIWSTEVYKKRNYFKKGNKLVLLYDAIPEYCGILLMFIRFIRIGSRFSSEKKKDGSILPRGSLHLRTSLNIN